MKTVYGVMNKICITAIVFLVCLSLPAAEAESVFGNPGNGMHPGHVQTVAWSQLGSGTDNEISAIACLSDTIYAGGLFQTAGGKSANLVAMWNGTSWSPLGSGIGGTFPYVSAVAVSGSDVYVGGLFTEAGGRSAGDIAVWNGYAWAPLGNGISQNADSSLSVDAIAISGKNIYVGGSFVAAGSVTANGIAVWNGASWSSLGKGVIYHNPYDSGAVQVGRVNSISVCGDDVYIGGSFDAVDTVYANGVAMWNGKVWSSLGNGLTMLNADFGKVTSGIVNAVAVNGDDVYVGGNFDHAGGINAHGIAMWNGKTWSSLGNVFDTSGVGETQVSALTISKNRVYAGGWFSISPVNALGIAKWDGAKWSSLGTGISSSFSSLGALALCNSGDNIYVGGEFITASGINAGNIAMFSDTSEILEVQNGNSALPGGFSLSQNYPNPFNPSTVIRYDIPVSDFVTMMVYDLTGRKVSTLVSKVERPGSYSVTFNARELPSGVYFYRLQAGAFSSVKKLLLLK